MEAHLKTFLLLALGMTSAVAYAGPLDTIGLTLLNETTTNLNGSGVIVVQVESGNGTAFWEVNPGAVGQPTNNFTYYSSNSVSGMNVYPNALGGDSGHADQVGQDFYGIPGGVATNAAHINNYEANYFVDSVVPAKTAISGTIVNQSFDASGATVNQLETLDTEYDNFSVQYNTLFITGAGDGGTVATPSTAYNGLSVGAYQGSSSVGPTPDNGRAKPDITAPYVQSSVTSFSTPLVSGSAAVLQQAGARGDGGSDTSAAVDPRAIKALLINGAIKPTDWTNNPPSPLDPRYGSGILNLFESYNQLIGGKHAFIDTSSVLVGSAHPPTSAGGNVSSLFGWDFNTLTSSGVDDAINHYYFSLPSTNAYAGTVTLVWNRQAGNTLLNTVNLNDFNLFLYNASSGTLITGSTSTVDNVQHMYTTNLPPGRYDVQVWKSGGGGSKNFSNADTYALAFEFFSEQLTIAPSNGNVALTWPVYPAGFVLQSTPSLAAPVAWSDVNTTPTVTGNQNVVAISPGSSYEFYRLSRP